MPRSHRPYPAEYRQRVIDLVRKGRTPEERPRAFPASSGPFADSIGRAVKARKWPFLAAFPGFLVVTPVGDDRISGLRRTAELSGDSGQLSPAGGGGSRVAAGDVRSELALEAAGRP